VHWTGDIFSEDLIGSVSNTIMGGIEGFKPYVHPDCTAHHNYDEPGEVLQHSHYHTLCLASLPCLPACLSIRLSVRLTDRADLT
jgi:hypothetical protein